MKPLNFGIIGAGRIVHWFLDDLKYCTAKDSIHILGIWNRTAAKALKVAEDYQIPHHYLKVQDLLLNPEIDAIYIGTDDAHHYEFARQALLHKKHVFVEKPICMTLDELEDLMRIAEESQLILFDGIKTGYSPAYRALRKEIIDNKVIGDIKYIQASHIKTSSSGRIPDPQPEDNVVGFHMAGGMYALFIALDLGGDPLDYTALTNSYPHNKAISTSIINIRHKNGAISTVAGSDSLTNNLQSIIMGTKGYALLGGNLAKYNNNYRKDSCHMAHTYQIFDLQNQLVSTCDMPFQTDGEGLCFEIDYFYKMFTNTQIKSQILPVQKTYDILKILYNTNQNDK